MKLFPGKDKKNQKNLAINGGNFFAMPPTLTRVDPSNPRVCNGFPRMFY